MCIKRNSDFQLGSLVRFPELNLAVVPIREQLVYIGVRPRGFDYSSGHSVGRTLTRESPSCLLFEIPVSRGCCQSLVWRWYYLECKANHIFCEVQSKRQSSYKPGRAMKAQSLWRNTAIPTRLLNHTGTPPFLAWAQWMHSLATNFKKPEPVP